MNIKDLDKLDEWEKWIIKDVCRISHDEYVTNKNIFTQKILENHLNEIIYRLEDMRENLDDRSKFGEFVFCEEAIDVAFQILAILILETGSFLPKKVKKEVLKSTAWEYDKNWGWNTESINLRRVYLDDFRNKIINHIPGKKTFLIDLKIGFDEQLKKTCIGLKNFNKFIESRKIESVNYVNLDNSDLELFPKELFSLHHLESLSLERNLIKEIPEEIERLNNLNSLWLCHNNIKKVPESICKLKNLKILSLIDNQINFLPKSIEKMKTTIHIVISNNPIVLQKIKRKV